MKTEKIKYFHQFLKKCNNLRKKNIPYSVFYYDNKYILQYTEVTIK
jgi:hypothetical protein